MNLPGIVVVDTSAAVEVLVADAECHAAYVALMAQLRVADAAIVVSDLLEAELIEAAYTWDVRREPGDWRRRRREGLLVRAARRELLVLDEWAGLLRGMRQERVGIASFLRPAARLMEQTGLGSFDAIHLAISIGFGAPLLTHDRHLARWAFEHAGAITDRRA